jgi:hypothetical protein|tara:strand:+ start:441 stop:797 length:357 start_codon:yes stop_codon:yes gene_type:complete
LNKSLLSSFLLENEKNIITFLEKEIESYSRKNEDLDKEAFARNLLERWVKGKIDFSILKSRGIKKRDTKTQRKRTPRVSISVERAVYSNLRKELSGSFTAARLLEFRKHIKSEIKNWK